MKKYSSKFIVKLFILVFLGLNFSTCYHSKKEDLSPLLSLITDKKISVLIVGDSLAERSDAFGLREKLGTQFEVLNISKSGWDIPLWMGNQSEILSKKSDILILGLGTNDANNYSTDLFPDRFKEMVNFLRDNHDWRLILTLVPPTDIPSLEANIRINNDHIRSDYTNYPIVDLFELFKKNQDLPLYPIIDPLHPNPIGYDLIGEEYKKKLLNF
ncbi:MAG: SGNH/GDSL hydrolase family protein [Leptospira sp.]|nr:SGNH/GDSL hydrolase family protein [Leptospira sp.]